jgi:hypothetical protein
VLSINLATTQIPVPFVNQLLVPAAVAPGAAALTLTVNGTGIANGVTVNWNGEPHSTSFVNSGRLTATVPAANVATAGTASVTVVNPGVTVASNVVLFTVTTATPSVAFASAAGSPVPVGVAPVWLSAADFNGDRCLWAALGNRLIYASYHISL